MEPWNDERKDVERQIDDRTCLSGIATSLESDLPTTVGPDLYLGVELVQSTSIGCLEASALGLGLGLLTTS